MLLNKVCAQGSGAAAVVLLAKHINIVCSVPLLIKEIYNAQAISSPARVKAIIFCIVAIIKKQNNNEITNILYFVIK